MALQACFELSQKVYTTVGDLTDWLDAVSPGERAKAKATAKLESTISGDSETSKVFEEANNNKDLENVPVLSWGDSLPVKGDQPPNPNCQESICVPSFWVKENNLCLYCEYRG